MFYKAAWLIGIVLGVHSVCAGTASAQSVPLGVVTKGEISGEKNYVENYNYGKFFRAEVSVSLQAGKSYSFTAKVVGKERRVSICIYDPSGELVTPSGHSAKLKEGGVEFTFEDAHVRGKYRIFVTSDKIGEYDIQVMDLGDEAAWQRRANELKRELALVEEKLKTFEARK